MPAAAPQSPAAASPGGRSAPTPPSTAPPRHDVHVPRGVLVAGLLHSPLRCARSGAGGSWVPAPRRLSPFAKAEGRLPGRNKFAICCGRQVLVVGAVSAAQCSQR
eukprot:13202451-Alexandrium_andersonii.AAC.1